MKSRKKGKEEERVWCLSSNLELRNPGLSPRHANSSHAPWTFNELCPFCATFGMWIFYYFIIKMCNLFLCFKKHIYLFFSQWKCKKRATSIFQYFPPFTPIFQTATPIYAHQQYTLMQNAHTPPTCTTCISYNFADILLEFFVIFSHFYTLSHTFTWWTSKSMWKHVKVCERMCKHVK